MRPRAWLAAAAFLVIAGACGGEPDPGITERASAELQLRVEALREASLSGDHASVLTALEDVRAAATNLKTNGDIDENKATEILAVTADIENLIGLVPTTTTTTTTTPPPPVIEDQGGGGDDNGKGRGDDKGKKEGK